MSVTIAANFPPNPSEIPQANRQLDHWHIAHRQFVYREVGELLFKVDGLLIGSGREPGDEVPIGQEELGAVGDSGVAVYDFVVGDRDGESLPFITRAVFRDGPNTGEPTRSLFFAENHIYASAFAVWEAKYRHKPGANAGSVVERAKPASIRVSRNLLGYLSGAATHLGSNPDS